MDNDSNQLFNKSLAEFSTAKNWNCSNYVINCTSFNETENKDKLSDLILYGTTSVILGLIILITVIGNVFVIAAIILERNLQHVANYLIVSLAVADLMVACLVMPLGAVYEINKGWILGPELCDIWTSFDVLCCTASILHLVAIAIDRYWAVTNVNYIHSRSVNRIGIMIFLIWLVAIIVSLAPQFGWKDPEYLDRINIQQKCLVSQDVAYQIFATCSTFYVPLLIILIVYWKIFQTARKRIHRRRKQKQLTKETPFAATSSNIKDNLNNNGHIESTNNLQISTDNNKDNKSSKLMAFWAKFSCDKRQKSSQKSQDSDTTTYELANTIRKESDASVIGTTAVNTTMNRRDKKESLEAKRERKAAKTLAIITGAFVVCWLPFFIMAVLLPLCDTCHMSDFVSSLFLWLGYFNSTLNPVIYTIFSPEFRQAFQRILCGTKRQNTTSSRYIVSTKGR